MAAATILYVGEDLCHRIPVMESNGIVVLRAACSVAGVRSSLSRGDGFSAVTFHNDLVPPAKPVIATAREICTAPLILFRNPSIECDEQVFDLVIPVPTPPDVWSKTLVKAIEKARKLHEHTRQLRQECADLREASQSLRERSIRNRVSPVDYDALFRGEADGVGGEPEDDGS